MRTHDTRGALDSTEAGHGATGWSRRTRLALAAGAALLVVLGVAVALDPPTWGGSPTSSLRAVPAPRPSSTLAENPQPAVVAGMDASCRQLVSVSAAALGAQPEAWTRSVLAGQLRRGQTLDEAIRERLSTARATMVRTRYTDPQLDETLARLDSALAQAAADPCSS
jgi:hypothetical protein